jgi:hypothetical protein
MNTTATTTQDPFRCDGLDMNFLLAAAELAGGVPTDADRVIALQSIRQHRAESGWAPIAGVRTALWHLDRAAQDELLTGMVRDNLVRAVPAEDFTPLTGRDHATALLLDGQWTHTIQAC